MKKAIILLILLAVVLSIEGCTEKMQGNSIYGNAGPEKNNVIEATSLEQINTSLQKGPVFLKIGSEWCDQCKEMKPILKELAAEYEGNVTVISVDADENPDIVKYFNVKPIPDSSIIMYIENGTYVYMQRDGSVGTDRSKARIIGLKDIKIFEKILNLSLLQEAGSVPEDNSTNASADLEKYSVIEVTSLEQINTYLQKGPVFLKMGSQSCKACQEMKPILEELATEYGGKVTVMSGDVDKSPDLAKYFNVKPIPDSFVITGTKNGKYVYLQWDGRVGTDRSKAGIVGLYDKEMYEEVLDITLLQEAGNYSNEK